jgi:lipopolysaccharide export system ATP-binding protein
VHRVFGRFSNRRRPVADNGQSELEVRALCKRYAGRWVVDGVSLLVRPSEIVGLLGPNGAGKTVTFSMISGMIFPDEGTVLLNGEDVTSMPMHERARRGIAYLTQERSVFRGLTAAENIAAVLEMHGARKREARQRAGEILQQFGLSRIADSRASRLSGGEQRRLEVARSVSTRPRFLLSDEPFAGVDPLTIEMLRGLFVQLRASGLGILLTDHNVRETLALCDRAYVLDDGRVLAHGTPAELVANEEVRHHFLGDSFTLEPGAPAGLGASAPGVTEQHRHFPDESRLSA